MTVSSDRQQAARLAARKRGLGRLSTLTAGIGLAGLAMAGVVAWALPGSKADSTSPSTTGSSSIGTGSGKISSSEDDSSQESSEDDPSRDSSDDSSSQSNSGGLVQAPSSQDGPQAVSGGS
jgi:hypothetical protein